MPDSEQLLAQIVIEAHESASEVLEHLEEHLHQLHETLSEIEGPLGRVGATVTGAAVPLLGFSAAALGGIAGLTKLGATVQDETTTIQNFGQLTDEQATQVKQSLLDLSNSSGASFSALAQSVAPYMGIIKQLPGAQADVVASTKEVTEAATQLHEAFGVDLPTAMDAVTRVLRDYHLPAEQASEVTNQLGHIMATAGVPVDQFTTVVERMKTRLGDLAPDLTTTGALVETLADHGITGTRALTMVAGGIEHLYTSQQAAKALEALGVELVDASGKAKPATEVMEELHKALFDSSAAAQNFALHQKDVEAAAKALNVAVVDTNGKMRDANDIIGDIASRYVGLRQDLQQTQAGYDALTKAIEEAKAKYGAHSQQVKALEEQQKQVGEQLKEQTKTVEEANKAFEKLGIQVKDTDGSLLDAQQITAQLKAKFGELDDQTRLLIASQLFGGQSASAFLTILKDTSAIDQHREALEKTEITAEGAERRHQTLAHQLEVFEQHVKNAGAAIGAAMVPSMTTLVEHLNHAIDAVQHFVEHHQQLVGILGTIVGAFGAFAGTLVAVALPLHLVVSAVGTLVSVFGPLTSVAGAVVAALGPIGLVLVGLAAAVGVVVIAWQRDWGHIREHVHDAVTVITQWLTSLEDFLKSLPGRIEGFLNQVGATFTRLATDAGARLNQFVQTVTQGFHAVVQAIAAVPHDIETGFTALIQAIVRFAGSVKDQFVTAFSTAIETAKQKIQEFPGWLEQTLQNLAYRVGYALGATIKFFIDLPGKIMDAVKALPGELEQLWTQIKQTAEQWWKETSDAVVTAAKSLWNETVTTVKNLPGDLEQIWTDIKEKADEAWKDVKTTVTETAKNLWDETVTTIKHLPGDLQAIWTDVKTQAQQAWTELKTTVTETAKTLWQDTVTTFKNLATDIATTRDEIKQGVITAFREMVTGVQTTVSDLPSIISGIFDQIVSMVKGWASSLWSVATSVASSFVSGFKAGLGIHSPSLPEQWIANIGTQAQTTLSQIEALAPSYQRALQGLTPHGHHATHAVAQHVHQAAQHIHHAATQAAHHAHQAAQHAHQAAQHARQATHQVTHHVHQAAQHAATLAHHARHAATQVLHHATQAAHHAAQAAHHARHAARAAVPLADLTQGGGGETSLAVSGAVSGGGPGILISLTIQTIYACSRADARRVGEDIGGAIADALRRRGLA